MLKKKLGNNISFLTMLITNITISKVKMFILKFGMNKLIMIIKLENGNWKKVKPNLEATLILLINLLPILKFVDYKCKLHLIINLKFLLTKKSLYLKLLQNK